MICMTIYKQGMTLQNDEKPHAIQTKSRKQTGCNLQRLSQQGLDAYKRSRTVTQAKLVGTPTLATSTDSVCIASRNLNWRSDAKYRWKYKNTSTFLNWKYEKSEVWSRSNMQGAK